MIVVGLVGRIASGKSTVARALESHGATVIDADRIAHDVLGEQDVVQEIVDRFGGDVLGPDGRVRRPALAAAVFGSTDAHDRALADLEAIVHPRVRQRIEERLAAIAAVPGHATAVVVLDVPLLMQVGWDSGCDRLVLIECPEVERQRRLDARGGTAEQRASRERAWAKAYRTPPAEKTWRVDASGDPAYTFKQVSQFWDSLQRG